MARREQALLVTSKARFQRGNNLPIRGQPLIVMSKGKKKNRHGEEGQPLLITSNHIFDAARRVLPSLSHQNILEATYGLLILFIMNIRKMRNYLSQLKCLNAFFQGMEYFGVPEKTIIKFSQRYLQGTCRLPTTKNFQTWICRGHR